MAELSTVVKVTGSVKESLTDLPFAVDRSPADMMLKPLWEYILPPDLFEYLCTRCRAIHANSALCTCISQLCTHSAKNVI